MTTQTILEEADAIINGPRRDSYGSVQESFQRIAELWSPILGQQISPEEVGLCMIQLKIARQVNKHGRDNLVDICGYASLIDRLESDKEVLSKS